MPSMLPFDLKKPLFGFTAKFPHAKRRIHLFADERFVYFRPKDEGPDWYGAFAGWEDFSKRIKTGDWGYIKQRGIFDCQHNQFFRVLDLPDPRPGQAQNWRVLWRPNLGFAIPSPHPAQLDGAFFWPVFAPFHLQETPTEALVTHFRKEWHASQSDVRAALPWCDWALEERRSRAIRWEKGSEEQLRQLVEAALKFWPWSTEESGHKRMLNAIWPDGKTLKIHFYSGESDGFLFRLKEMWPLLISQNQGIYDHRSGDRRDWRLGQNPGSESFKFGLRFEVEQPTSAHERLEAALFLRDWLEQHAPDLLLDWFPDATNRPNRL